VAGKRHPGDQHRRRGCRTITALSRAAYFERIQRETRAVCYDSSLITHSRRQSQFRLGHVERRYRAINVTCSSWRQSLSPKEGASKRGPPFDAPSRAPSRDNACPCTKAHDPGRRTLTASRTRCACHGLRN